MRFTPLCASSKSAPHGAHADVLPFLADHLQLLDIGHAAVRIEHENLRVLHIAEALERSLASVAGRRDQNADRLVLAGLSAGSP